MKEYADQRRHATPRDINPGDIVLVKQPKYNKTTTTYGSIFGKRALLAIDHIMLALFWSNVPNMK